MKSSIKYVGKRLGTELIVGGLLFGITSGMKYAARKFYEKKTEKDLRAALAES